MAKREFKLTPEQVNELLGAYQSSSDGATRTRFQAVRLYGSGYSAQEVMDITNCSRSSLMGWCRQYRLYRVLGLVDKRVGGNHCHLTPTQIQELADRLQQYTPRQLFGEVAYTADGQFWTAPDLQAAVQHWYGVVYQSHTSYLEPFKRCGFSYQRPAKVFKSRRAAQVAEFEAQLEKKC